MERQSERGVTTRMLRLDVGRCLEGMRGSLAPVSHTYQQEGGIAAAVESGSECFAAQARRVAGQAYDEQGSKLVYCGDGSGVSPVLLFGTRHHPPSSWGTVMHARPPSFAGPEVRALITASGVASASWISDQVIPDNRTLAPRVQQESPCLTSVADTIVRN